MITSVRPMLSSLLRNRTGPILVALQIAIAIAVTVNAAWIVGQRVASIKRPTGLDDANTFVIAIAGLTSRFDLSSALTEDLAYLRGMPGVVAATASETVPLTGDGENTQLWLQPGERGPSASLGAFDMDTQGLATLGTSLISGRNFRPEEIQPFSKENIQSSVPEIILTRSLAVALFGSGDAVGKVVYDGAGRPMTVIGITRDFMGPVGMGNPVYQNAVLPKMPGAYGAYFCLVRTRPGQALAIMQRAERHLATSNPDRVIFFANSLHYYHERMNAENRNMAIFLATVTAMIVAVASLGIFGLATYNVSARTKQIGTRRAVGARKRDIVGYFMLENACILGAAVLAGCALALGVGYWLSMQYGLPRLDLYYLVGGILVLWVIGQLAAWQPARRAASVPPSVATRTV